ncbi:O-methyltransferase [Phytohalomonas tamaricis]|uniref:hypothetical protein n=1 Tax=Phytohalomonas tamaricis TaxID=2081032 RepID=UPI000D0ABE2B|nr:hypothetical protein [Phytohalomonas tamaricis]
MMTQVGSAGHVDFKVGDIVKMVETLPSGLDVIFVGLGKNLFAPCLEDFYPKLNPGVIIVADNMLRPGNEEVKHYGGAIRARPAFRA